MEKAILVEALVNELRSRYDRAVGALTGAREAATGTDTKAENKYDTRGLEASYLAAGQAEQADELLRAIHLVETCDFPDFDFDAPVGTGALVEVEQDGEIRHYLLAPAGGGITLDGEGGGKVTVLGPASPLARALLGKTAGSLLAGHDLAVLEVF